MSGSFKNSDGSGALQPPELGPVSKSGPRNAEGHKKKKFACSYLLSAAASVFRQRAESRVSAAALNFIARQPLAQFSWAVLRPQADITAGSTQISHIP